MELVNKSKIDCIIDTIVRKRLIVLFKYRWLIESKEEWRNNPQFSLKLNKYCGGFKNKTYHSTEINYIENGSLHLFPISYLIEILIESKFKTLESNENDNNILKNQNEIIKSMYDLIKIISKIEETTPFINELNYNEFLNKFKELLVLFDKTLTSTIENEINNKFNNNCGTTTATTTKPNNEDRILYFNQDIGNSIKERGNNEFDKKNFKHATDIYQDALEMDGISDDLKSIIYLNSSKAYYQLSISLVGGKLCSKRGEDHIILQVSLYNSLQSIINAPNWSKPYFTAAKIYSRFGEYIKSNNYFQSSLVLLNSEHGGDGKSVEESKIINEFINENNKKLKLKTSTTTTTTTTTTKKSNQKQERDFEKEAKIILLKIGDCLKIKYGNLKITDKWLLSNIDNNDLVGFPKNFGSYENNFLAYKRTTEKIVLSKADLFYLSPKTSEKAILFYSYCIGNDSEWAQPYLKCFFNIIYDYDYISESNNLILSLLLKASLQPPTLKLKFKMPRSLREVEKYITDNNQVLQVYSELGKIYYHGYFNQDYDHEKAFYYFQLVVSNHDGAYSKDQNFAFFSLGLMYALGQTPQKKPNLEKAKEIWNKGISVGDLTCAEYLNIYNKPPYLSPAILPSSIEEKTTTTTATAASETTEAIGTYKPHSNFKGIGIDILNYEVKQTKHPIDTYEIKVMANKGKCQYSKLVYKTIGFVSQFSRLIGRKGLTEEEMFDTIKPLSDAYRTAVYDYDSFSFIRFTKEKLELTRILMDKLFKSNPKNLNVRVCWLGLNRFAGNFNEKFEFAKDSIKYCSGGNDDEYQLIFVYFQCVFLQYQGEFNKAFELASCTLRGRDVNTDHGSRDAFVYISTSVAKHFNENEILAYTLNNITYEKAWLEKAILNQSKGDPHLPDIFFNLGVIYSKLSLYETSVCAEKFVRYGHSFVSFIEDSYLDLFKKFNNSFEFARIYFQDRLKKDELEKSIKESKIYSYQVEKPNKESNIYYRVEKSNKRSKIYLVMLFPILLAIVLYAFFKNK